MSYKPYIFILFTILCLSCVEEYKIPENKVKNLKSEMVVEGRILSGGESYIYVSRTVPFEGGKVNPDSTSIPDALITIIGKNGYESSPAIFKRENNHYTINTRNLQNNTEYAIKVKYDGETYQSDYLTLLNTPEIDEVIYKEREDGISIHVSTHGNENHSPYYMWSCEEDWEFHSDFDFVRASQGICLYSGDTYVLENDYENPYYYCWGHSNSTGIHVYNAESLSENTLKNVELYRIPISDIRISYIYSVLVKQWSLDKNAYLYYETMRKQTEENNSLFAPMPTDVEGNVECTSNPKVQVRGYVLASNIKTKRIFVYASDFQSIIPEYSNCSFRYGFDDARTNPFWTLAWNSEIWNAGSVVYTQKGEMELESIKYSKECVDCRQTKGATKKRPDFWPTNHE